tara:strand:- start:1060 stop:1284 length:225 start_codon:yes stop_codon:yes gene_type:complete
MKTPPKPKDPKKYPIWVPITVPVTRPEMLFYVGRKCKEFEPQCVVCKEWKRYEATGKIRTIIERRAGVLCIEEE